MFTLVGLTKTLPDKSKDILKNINLSFYPGAKIGVVGLNGSGKVSFDKVCKGSSRLQLLSVLVFLCVCEMSIGTYLIMLSIHITFSSSVNSFENHGWD